MTTKEILLTIPDGSKAGDILDKMSELMKDEPFSYVTTIRIFDDKIKQQVRESAKKEMQQFLKKKEHSFHTDDLLIFTHDFQMILEDAKDNLVSIEELGTIIKSSCVKECVPL